ncbi:hypothetical protein EIP91_009319 [Steccherinum ochraceum]|uniref:Uncharacterized protein n=1 Tax=Steccherinum ochraceum TaxID=92696 RepID=A0A4R0R4E8_9APHY|nr:hypothetical protein EIP91_009319 [Steccherinum ochraceum]
MPSNPIRDSDSRYIDVLDTTGYKAVLSLLDTLAKREDQELRDQDRVTVFLSGDTTHFRLLMHHCLDAFGLEESVLEALDELDVTSNPPSVVSFGLEDMDIGLEDTRTTTVTFRRRRYRLVTPFHILRYLCLDTEFTRKKRKRE